MFKILILSNGHGEDLSGSLIAKQFVKSGYSVHALPIVGKGNHYEKEKIKIIGKTKEFCTGGIGYNSFKGRLTEILGGVFFFLLKRLYLTYKIKKKIFNFSVLNFSKKIALIGGTGYTGEIKKGIFSALNFSLPIYKNTLPMHCSANVGEYDSTALFFGLSGTGKTTLSTNPKRKLIGDDEHGWTLENTIFNFEGGCYAKVINLSKAQEPDIYKAIKKGAILENVVMNAKGVVDFSNKSITPNTRVSYPIDHIENIQSGSIGGNPKNIFFLTADAFGVLPPISKLTPAQAAYHFISGYTAKVAGTEAGVNEPKPIFSACFGAPFMPLHPTTYAEMLTSKMKANGATVWLVNTGSVSYTHLTLPTTPYV